MPPRQPEGQLTRHLEAEQSAGRAAGYCWVEHPNTASHCTRPPGHYPKLKHTNYYRPQDGEYD